MGGRLSKIAWAALLLCSIGVQVEGQMKSMENTQAGASKASAANDRFALALFDAVKTPERNTVVSSVCVSHGLYLAAAGARGATRQQMLTMLGKDDSRGAVDAWLKIAHQLHGDPQRDLDLSVAAGVWSNRGVPLQPGFVSIAKDKFSAAVGELDFAQPTSADVINSWVAGKTNGKINRIVDSKTLAGNILLLASTAYLKAPWTNPFRPEQTQDEDFTTAGKTVRVKMMHQNQDHPAYYGEDDSFQTLSLAFGYGDVAMWIVLPRKADGLEAAEKVLANKGMDGLLGKRKTNVRVEIALPRFKITSGFELNDPLKKMGMTDAFSSHADFSGLTEIRPAFLSRVMHSVLIETDEKGTEAAAVMVAMVGAAIQRVPPENVSFRADHPFLFMITHADTGAILFVGHVVDPSAE